MRNSYKIPWHIRVYVKIELMDYKKNRQLLSKVEELFTKLDIHTRFVLLMYVRLSKIEEVFEELDAEERQAAEMIFIDHYSRAGCETAKGISKSAYYTTMNKVIYLTARKFELI